MSTPPETVPGPIDWPWWSIRVSNEGWYVAEFVLAYTDHLGQRRIQNSGHITLGSSKSLPIPDGSTGIILQVAEWSGFGWRTIFTRTFNLPVARCYLVWGTTLSPRWAEIPC